MADQVVEPSIPIVDAHHHLYASNHWADGSPYLLREFASDLGSGHKVVATVYVESGAFHRQTGPEHLRVAGEVAFAAVMGALSDTGQFGTTRVCQAIVGNADLTSGARLIETLEALQVAGDGRLRGIRAAAQWDPDPLLSPGARAYAPEGLLRDTAFRAGVRVLGEQGLIFDAWQYYPQLADLAELADANPNVSIVCGHCGGLVGNRAYDNPENFERWRNAIQELARRPNVIMKIGGLAHDRTGFGFRGRAERPSEDDLVETWKPYVESCIEAFGADRCMFESNFPVDSVATTYRSLWNVYKTVVAAYSSDEKNSLFSGTARRAYKLGE